MTDEVQQAFVNYVEAGGGLLAVHSGTAEYQETPTLRRLLGGVFTHHPETVCGDGGAGGRPSTDGRREIVHAGG